MKLHKAGKKNTIYVAIVSDFLNGEISSPRQIEARDELEGRILVLKEYIYGRTKETPYDGFNLENPEDRQAAEDLFDAETDVMELEVTLIDPLEYLP